MSFQLRSMMLLAGLLLPAFAAADISVTKEDFKKYVETQEALQDPRVQKIPEGKRIPEIARVNFKMGGPALQAILEKVEGEGGASGLSEKSKVAVGKALDTLEFKTQLKEIRVDTGSAHVVTYVKWTTDGNKLAEEAIWLALRTANASPLTSTIYLWAVDESGADLWRAKIGADRMRHVQEKRIGDWAKTRYLRLFEVDMDGVFAEPKAGAGEAGLGP